MLVCICNGISDRDIDEALSNGANNISDLRNSLGLGNCCGQCASFAKDMIGDRQAQPAKSSAFNLAYEAK
jgi:bacterioferritin-associated ferredoxin